MKNIRKIIEIDGELCNGCGQCVPSCAEGALQIVDGKARLTSEIYCDGLGACLGECPQGALRVIEREAEGFDEKAVEANRSVFQPKTVSALTHWPVQIKLIPPTAPFLRGAHLLVAADCTAFAYPVFHSELLKGKVLMIGCPKFDNVQEYVYKFAEIFKNAGIKSVTVVDMEVPCCSKLPLIVRKGMEISGRDILIEEVVISTQGRLLKRVQYAA
ncbi:MAG: 4Fe-4S ferredoxin [Thermodesulfovibrio sp.]|nr:4Fe-4S ferredoxin [Thermodesulfovibrio sp.]